PHVEDSNSSQDAKQRLGLKVQSPMNTNGLAGRVGEGMPAHTHTLTQMHPHTLIPPYIHTCRHIAANTASLSISLSDTDTHTHPLTNTKHEYTNNHMHTQIEYRQDKFGIHAKAAFSNFI